MECYSAQFSQGPVDRDIKRLMWLNALMKCYINANAVYSLVKTVEVVEP